MEPTRRPKVLVVDDNPDNRRVVVRLLARRQLDASSAAGGQEALERLAAEPFELVLLDGMMPGLDGPATAREIRRREAAAGVGRLPIVALTGSGEPADLARMLEAGMDDLIVKPILPGALEDALARWLPVAGTRNDVLPAAPEVAWTASEDLDGVDVDPSAFDRLAVLSDRALAGRLVAAFLADAQGRVDQVDGALEARDAGRARDALGAIDRIGILVGASGLCRRAHELDAELGDRSSPDDPRWSVPLGPTGLAALLAATRERLLELEPALG